jgi:hypothetical protein
VCVCVCVHVVHNHTYVLFALRLGADFGVARMVGWLVAAFIFILNATPSTGSAWFFFYSSKPPQGLGFTSEFLGTINVVGSVFNLAGVVFFQAVCKRMPFRPILLWGTIISTVLGLSNLILVFHWNRAVSHPHQRAPTLPHSHTGRLALQARGVAYCARACVHVHAACCTWINSSARVCKHDQF